MKMTKFFALAVCIFLLSFELYADIGNTATQQTCTQTGTDSTPVPPNANNIWNTGGLNRNLDRMVYRRNIIAYKIKWSTGWSGWIVKGVNDLYAFATPSTTPSGAIDARLTWIYFYDHEHQFISCN
ncbi:MAG: hypothetical protein PHY93_20620 [Bacteriovorax sp.]|nr:hypothetical protein [Bacteriovorax sp.]